MAQAPVIITIMNAFSLILSLSFLPWTSASFTMKLIHRDSPLSPLYQPNLTDFQRFSRNVEISKARAIYFQQHMDVTTSKAKQNTSIRLPARLYEPIFTAEMGIGTPSVKRTLLFDTGSSLTWTQCTPCVRCFKQNDPFFEPQRSSTYRAITTTHPLSKGFACTPFGCNYYVGYLSGQYSGGNLASESFTFQTNLRNSPAVVSNLVFGCGTSNGGNYPPEISGLIGMSQQPLSFVRQLETIIKSRFSYCLSPKSPSFVKFGDEARIRGWWPKKTPLLNNNRHYGLNLIDLSINGRKLRLGSAAFPGGCIIDSGSSVSLLSGRAYAAVRDTVVKYFSMFKEVRRYVGERASDKFVCYSYPAGFRSYPSMTFHFKGADYSVPASNLFFFVEGNVFCLAIMESKDINILGAFQQRNVRIVYDLKEKMLSFGTEDCSRDS